MSAELTAEERETLRLAARIRAEASISSRPGQFARLEEIADELLALVTATEQRVREKVAREIEAARDARGPRIGGYQIGLIGGFTEAAKVARGSSPATGEVEK